MPDIYFDNRYGELYEKIEDGNFEVFEHNSDYGKVKYSFIKKKIPYIIDGMEYFDTVTPYGYGGPVILDVKQGCEEELVNGFNREFDSYCEQNGIVSEFVRFHPLFKNSEAFKQVYDVTHVRNTVGTNLKDYDDPFQSEFSKSCKKTVRKALKDGVTYKIIERPTNIKEFQKIYYSTMQRNNASDYYYFDYEYFNKAMNLFSDNIIIVKAIYGDKTIAMGFYFVYKDIIHMHLSGTLSEHLSLSPAYILKYAVTLWGKEKGYEIIHHGGGKTNSSDDGLFLFKKKFGKNTEYEFCVGKKIRNANVYKKLCDKTGVNLESDFFPAYRG